MINTITGNNKKYWFVMEPFVFVSIKNNTIFFYNTLDGFNIESSDVDVFHLFTVLVNKKKSILLLDEVLLKKENIVDLISVLRENFMADIIDISLTKDHPFQFTPILNLQNSVERLKSDKNRSVGENLLEHLHEVTLFLKNVSDFPNKDYPVTTKECLIKNVNHDDLLSLDLIKELLNQLVSKKDLRINIIIKNLIDYSEWFKLLYFLNTLPFKKRYSFQLNNINSMNNLYHLIDGRSKINYIMDFSNPDDIDCLLSLNKRQIYDDRNEFSFLVDSERSLEKIEDYIDKQDDFKYHIIPVYNGGNINFFENNVYMDKDDILESPISMRQIFINQTINIESFGKMSIVPGGNVFTNIFHTRIGNIKKKSVLEMIYSEMNTGISWFNTRKSFPCNECLYQWLCATPSVYESIFNKVNLCHVNL
ncbi:hypothetical protein FACS1894179_05950 [Bacteroidia bacterium]|nr:hypothetical protein FACS1894179_05950 [Bacteroidia bacterium]